MSRIERVALVVMREDKMVVVLQGETWEIFEVSKSWDLNQIKYSRR